jgi:hypothetical protein
MQAQGGSVWPSQPPPNYIEDVFSTWIYFGNGATQTITNNIDLATKGGMVWGRPRDVASDFSVFDSIRGSNWLLTDGINAQQTNTGFAMTTTGFSMTNMSTSAMNYNGSGCVSWTFRKQPKFFDVVSWTGTGSNRTIAHNLGSVPGCIIVKKTSSTGQWCVYHQNLTSASYGIFLNLTDAQTSDTALWNSTAPTSTVFSLGSSTGVNASGATYVAYLFASNAGGFGLTGTDNVITCGSFTTNGSGAATISLGYEPQWVITKRTDGVSDWQISDTMRGASLTSYGPLNANNTNAEDSGSGTFVMAPSATGASFANLGASRTFIYIAIRRGPMKVPTLGTSVFNTVLQTPSTYSAKINEGFPVDLLINGMRAGTGVPQYVESRLQGVNTTRNDSGSFPYLSTSTTNAETLQSWGLTQGWDNTGFYQRSLLGVNIASWAFQRAPSVFDVVCYTGNGVAGLNVAHNLGVVPELMIVKCRNNARFWYVYSATLGATKNVYLNVTSGEATDNTAWNDTAPTSTQFTLGNGVATNASGIFYVAYLFATCAGVSKVGSYSGTGATQTINCGFTGGARFVLIKRTDSTGDWYVWDTARGMVSGTDPSLLLNSGSSEVNANSVYTATTGFQIVSTAAGINASGGTYIFLAIA